MIRTYFACLPRSVCFVALHYGVSDIGHQITEEIGALFDFMESIYGIFGFEYRFELSTRPDNYLGTIETWNMAEEVSIFRYTFLIASKMERCDTATAGGTR